MDDNIDEYLIDLIGEKEFFADLENRMGSFSEPMGCAETIISLFSSILLISSMLGIFGAGLFYVYMVFYGGICK